MQKYFEKLKYTQQIPPSVIENNILKDIANKNKERFLENQPFPHIILDNFFDPRLLSDIEQEFPNLEMINHIRFKDKNEHKLASLRGDLAQPPKTKSFLQNLNSHAFIDFLQILTSMKERIIPDPHFIGGGLHQIKQGGFLKLHTDFNKHPETHLDRRINLLLYLNKDWKEEYGGHLELWDKDLTKCHQKILPIFNRMVIFNTNDYTYHGHPHLLTCPSNRSRKSLSVYYYSNGRPSSETDGIVKDTFFKETS